MFTCLLDAIAAMDDSQTERLCHTPPPKSKATQKNMPKGYWQTSKTILLDTLFGLKNAKWKVVHFMRVLIGDEISVLIGAVAGGVLVIIWSVNGK